jgi:hypothetical protein
MEMSERVESRTSTAQVYLFGLACSGARFRYYRDFR